MAGGDGGDGLSFLGPSSGLRGAPVRGAGHPGPPGWLGRCPGAAARAAPTLAGPRAGRQRQDYPSPPVPAPGPGPVGRPPRTAAGTHGWVRPAPPDLPQHLRRPPLRPRRRRREGEQGLTTPAGVALGSIRARRTGGGRELLCAAHSAFDMAIVINIPVRVPPGVDAGGSGCQGYAHAALARGDHPPLTGGAPAPDRAALGQPGGRGRAPAAGAGGRTGAPAGHVRGGSRPGRGLGRAPGVQLAGTASATVDAPVAHLNGVRAEIQERTTLRRRRRDCPPPPRALTGRPRGRRPEGAQGPAPGKWRDGGGGRRRGAELWRKSSPPAPPGGGDWEVSRPRTAGRSAASEVGARRMSAREIASDAETRHGDPMANALHLISITCDNRDGTEPG